MENYARYKTTEKSTTSPSEISTHFLSFQTSSPTYGELTYIPSSTSAVGYNNVRIKDGDEHKAAFKTGYGLYEPTVMFFSLTNSPGTFQTMINHIFCPLIAKHELLGTSIRVYMDDIAIATGTCDDNHTAAVTNVLQLAADHDLYFKRKSAFSTHQASITWG